jgi:dimethylhistidine N-methyltransferase
MAVSPRLQKCPAPLPAARAALPSEEASAAFAADVQKGLTRASKSLPSQYFYDDLGSQLFEAICQLPWYPITRAERRLLDRFAPAMVAALPDLSDLVELGSGSGDKIATLASVLSQRPSKLNVHLIDISEKALELSQGTLSRLPHVDVTTHPLTYEAGLRALGREPSAPGSTLVLFLGSNIGNFDPKAARRLLVEIRRALRPGDGLLLGADLIRPEADLVLAYDDPLGVTAAFNKNLLQRMNAELDANFDLDAWEHRAVWNAVEGRVEMHLVSRRAQRAQIPRARVEIDFAEGETIWTESSYKYTPEAIVKMGLLAGFHRKEQWIEPSARFATTLFLAGSSVL